MPWGPCSPLWCHTSACCPGDCRPQVLIGSRGLAVPESWHWLPPSLALWTYLGFAPWQVCHPVWSSCPAVLASIQIGCALGAHVGKERRSWVPGPMKLCHPGFTCQAMSAPGPPPETWPSVRWNEALKVRLGPRELEGQYCSLPKEETPFTGVFAGARGPELSVYHQGHLGGDMGTLLRRWRGKEGHSAC